MRKIATIAALLFVFGCASETTTPPIDQLEQGLNVLSVTPDQAVSAAFVAGDQVIYFQAIRGPETSEFYRENLPGTPMYETDVRFVDENGETFYWQMGGDSFIDPSWTTDLAQPPANIGLLRRLDDLLLAHQAADALDRADLLGVKSEIQAIQGVARSVSRDEIASQRQAALQVTGSETSYTGAYDHDVRIYWQSLLVMFEHSATRVYTMAKGTFSYYQVGYNCNHGACSNSSSMTYKCYWNSRVHGGESTGRPGYALNEHEYSTTQSIGQSGWGCQTPYGWSSSGYVHNCHDDSAVQVTTVKQNAWQNLYSGRCNGPDGSYWSPGC